MTNKHTNRAVRLTALARLSFESAMDQIETELGIPGYIHDTAIGKGDMKRICFDLQMGEARRLYFALRANDASTLIPEKSDDDKAELNKSLDTLRVALFNAL